MKFSDKIERTALEVVFVIRTAKEMEAREEYNSNLWNLEREFNSKKKENLYSIPVRDLKISESIVKANGKMIAYRTE